MKLHLLVTAALCAMTLTATIAWSYPDFGPGPAPAERRFYLSKTLVVGNQP